LYPYYRSPYPIQDQRLLGFAFWPLAAGAFLGGLIGGGIGGAIGSRPPFYGPGFGYPGMGYPAFPGYGGYSGFGAMPGYGMTPAYALGAPTAIATAPPAGAAAAYATNTPVVGTAPSNYY
jgi:hypothetical protein